MITDTNKLQFIPSVSPAICKKIILGLFVFLYFLSLKSSYLLLLTPLDKDIVTTYESCQSVIVLGGRDDYDRILKGLELAQGHREPLVIFSGTHPKYEAVVQRFELSRLIFEKDSTNTYENAKNSSELLQEHNISSACLVTSEAHLYRASEVFKGFGIDTVKIASNRVSTHLGLNTVVPDLKYFVLNISVIYEYLAIASYKLKGSM